MPALPEFNISVRELVEFVLRTGDLGGSQDFIGPTRALQGIRGHQRIQRSRPKAYTSEVPISYSIQKPEFILNLKGRIDGILPSPGKITLEEIKTHTGSKNQEPNPLHWAQAKVYGWIYAEQNTLPSIELQLTYLHLESQQIREFQETFSKEDLTSFFEKVTESYCEWLQEYVRWWKIRNGSIENLTFPFSAYREGQRTLSVAAYKTIVQFSKLFVEAPTGIGKTISVLFPSIKAMGEGHLSKIFYLTAKTVGRTVAEKAFQDLREKGLQVRSLTLTAKDKICFNDGQPCEVQDCPFAKGYYDRVKPAIRETLARETINRAVLEEIAQKYQVCPFELSLDAALWVDAIICDYNYVFDPSVYLRRFFEDQTLDCVFLVDEAHNLLDRARDMFSADLHQEEIGKLKDSLGIELPACIKALNALDRYIKDLPFDDEQSPYSVSRIPEQLLSLLNTWMEEAEAWLSQNITTDYRDELLNFYFRAFRFLSTSELYGEHYRTILKHSQQGVSIHLYCVDPAPLLQEALRRGKASIFFSATLRPLEYFRELLGGDTSDRILKLTSPFPPENLSLMVHSRIRTDFRSRAASYDPVAEAISSFIKTRKGNYLVYFPSYRYLEEIAPRFQNLSPECEIVLQTPEMNEQSRTSFLNRFQTDTPETLVGFAVMGGIFGEGIDLIGDRLVGAVIVGVGLPQLCIERNLIQTYFEERKGSGFEYAYTYPGFNRVLQAVGRVIRSENDQGAVLLIDSRFREHRYQAHFPSWWNPVWIRDSDEIQKYVKTFWSKSQLPSS
jgi:DNA excision repair protein ERCC-2